MCLGKAKNMMVGSLLGLLMLIPISQQCKKASQEQPSQSQGIRAARLIQLAEDVEVFEPSSNQLENVEKESPEDENDEIVTGRPAKQVELPSDIVACFSILQEGRKFYSSVVREEVTSRNVSDCAKLCKSRPYCKTFSFWIIGSIQEQGCFLSELAEDDITMEEDTVTDSDWSIYSVEETNSCNDDVEAASVKPKDCECNGFIDEHGGGECRQKDDMGQFWCYVDREASDCPSSDTHPDPFLSFLSRSSHACSTSTGSCECNNYSFASPGQEELCMSDIFDGSKYCYVPLSSRCEDKRESKFYPSFHWSLDACKEDSEFASSTSPSQRERKEPVLRGNKEVVVGEEVEVHRHWNFTSSYTECVNYCSNSERCILMHAHYDEDKELCHLNPKPLYVVHYSPFSIHRHLVK